jgi:hypothetical protein
MEQPASSEELQIGRDQRLKQVGCSRATLRSSRDGTWLTDCELSSVITVVEPSTGQSTCNDISAFVSKDLRLCFQSY